MKLYTRTMAEPKSYSRKRLEMIRKLNAKLRSDEPLERRELMKKLRDRLVYEQGSATSPTLAFIAAKEIV